MMCVIFNQIDNFDNELHGASNSILFFAKNPKLTFIP